MYGEVQVDRCGQYTEQIRMACEVDEGCCLKVLFAVYHHLPFNFLMSLAITIVIIS